MVDETRCNGCGQCVTACAEGAIAIVDGKAEKPALEEGDDKGAANTVLVMAGDVTVERARELAQKYFGHIEAGPPVTQPKAWVPTRLSDTYEVMYDRVPQARVFHNWVAPGRTTRDAVELSLAAAVSSIAVGFDAGDNADRLMAPMVQMSCSARTRLTKANSDPVARSTSPSNRPSRAATPEALSLADGWGWHRCAVTRISCAPVPGIVA